MHVPTEDELAAIAAAYLLVTESAAEPPRPPESRWKRSGRNYGADEFPRAGERRATARPA